MSLFKFIFSKTFLKNIGFAILFVIILVGGLWIYLNVYTSHGSYISVPDVKGMNLEEADLALQDNELRYLVIDSVWSENQIGGTIVEQSPLAESEVKANREIYLTIYRFEPESKLIDIKEGDDERVAMIKLRNKGIEFDLDYEANLLLDGRVIRVMHKDKSLEEGARLKPGQKVRLIIGERGNKKVQVPYLFGLSLDSAEIRLQNANLSIGLPFYDVDIENAEDTLAATIYMQSPSASEKGDKGIRIGSTVDVWLSKRKIETVRDSLSKNSKKADIFDTP